MSHDKWLKKLNLTEQSIHMGVFDFKVVVVIGPYSSLTEYIQFKFEDRDFNTDDFDMGYECRGKCIYRQGFVPVVWLPRYPKTPREHATLAHECLHATMWLFRWIGIKVNDETEEVMTHTMAHIINSILENKHHANK